jgi:DNA polymerase
MTAFRRHVERWHNCTRCELHSSRCHVVLARGKIPCDICFVAEAPGDSEDSLGQPLVGPAGDRLNFINKRAGADKFRLAFTNIIGCIPLDNTRSKGKLPQTAIDACRPRLEEFIVLAQPRLLVTVGRYAELNLPTSSNSNAAFALLISAIPRIAIVHPAAILRVIVPAIRASMTQQAIVTLKTAIRTHLLSY